MCVWGWGMLVWGCVCADYYDLKTLNIAGLVLPGMRSTTCKSPDNIATSSHCSVPMASGHHKKVSLI